LIKYIQEKIFERENTVEEDHQLKYLDNFHVDDPHDDCSHWIDKLRYFNDSIKK
jgi:hypothetical protein